MQEVAVMIRESIGLIFEEFMEDVKSGSLLVSSLIVYCMFSFNVFEHVSCFDVVKTVLLVHVAVLLHRDSQFNRKFEKLISLDDKTWE